MSKTNKMSLRVNFTRYGWSHDRSVKGEVVTSPVFLSGVLELTGISGSKAQEVAEWAAADNVHEFRHSWEARGGTSSVEIRKEYD